jgi:S-DNA-T family DNA segregation ATPase FtsK/SpoIIIE
VKLVPTRWITPPRRPVAPTSAVGDRIDGDRIDGDGQVAHNRVPYRRVVVRSADLEPLPAPPDPPGARKLSLVATFLPVVGAVAMAVVMGRPEFLLLAVVSPLLLIHRHVSGRLAGRTGYRRGRDQFLERVEARAGEVDAALTAERDDRLLAAPDPDELGRHAAGRAVRLWERNRDAPDFLDLRLGLGPMPSLVRTSVERGGDPELRTVAEARLAHHTEVRAAPVTVDLVAHAVVGVHGDADHVRALGTSIVVQAVCLHSPDDLVVAAAVPSAEQAAHAYLAWLPHTRSPASPLDGSHVAVGDDETRRLLHRLLAVVTERVGRSQSGDRDTPWPRLLVLLHEGARPDPSLVARLLDRAPVAGLSVLWLGTVPQLLPRQCRALVQVTRPSVEVSSSLHFTDPAVDCRSFSAEGLGPDMALRIARHLAPVRDAGASSAATALPRSVPLLDALGLPGPTAEVVIGRWSAGDPAGLRAVLGQAADGPFAIDLVHDGPHALIGGTSGAGKSELLQSLVASLAVDHPPERLTFLFIDYKGGALSAEFRDLPHNVGTVTNLDGRLALRVLTSLRAELVRRMAVLEGRAKDLAELLRRAPDDTPPRLVIVVDEFATLVKEIPEFVDGLVDVAQRGRSLGVHLILATQRPGAAVNDNILGNTNLRIALRVVDPGDSMSIIGSRDAADIPVPLHGRAYARTGPGAVTAFQCSWSGAPVTEGRVGRPIVVRPFGRGADVVAGVDATQTAVQTPVRSSMQSSTAEPTVVRASPRSSSGASVAASVQTVGSPGAAVGRGGPAGCDGGPPPAQLGTIVRAVAEAARRSGRPVAVRPWIEPLPELVSLGEVTGPVAATLAADPGRTVVVGLLDDPGNQAQPPASVDLEATGGLVVLGTGGSGKTTLLRSIAAGLARQGGVDAVQIYGLDLAGRALDQISVLPNTAEVVAGDDLERVTRLIAVLAREVDRRRRLLADARAETVSALRSQAGRVVLPRLVLLIDGFPGLQAAFDRTDVHEWMALLLRVIADGRQVGIHTVVTTDRRNLPTALLSAMGGRLVLRTAEPEDMSAFGVPSKVARDADLVPGRGFLQGSHEVQVVLVGDDPSGAGQAAALQREAERPEAVSRAAARRAKAGRRARPVEPCPVVAAAPPLPELPELVTLDAAPTAPFRVPLGLTDLDLDVFEIDLARRSVAVCGPPQSGRSTALSTIAAGLGRTHADLLLAGVGAASSPLAALPVWDLAGFGRAGQVDVLDEVLERFDSPHAARRLPDSGRAMPAGDLDRPQIDPSVRRPPDSGRSMPIGDLDRPESCPLAVVFIDSVEDLEAGAGPLLDRLVRAEAVRLVVAAGTVTLSRGHSGWLGELRRSRTLVVLQPENRGEVDQVAGVRPRFRPGQAFPPGRGVLVAQRTCDLVQVALPTWKQIDRHETAEKLRLV